MPFDSILFSRFKGGYWFTYFLFLFIVIYCFLCWSLNKITGKENNSVVIFILSTLVGVAPVAIDMVYPDAPDSRVLQALSYQEFYFFMFFCFGAWIKSEFERYEKLESDKKYRAVIVALPLLLLIAHGLKLKHVDFPITVLFSFSAIMLIMLIFRDNASSLSCTRWGKCLSFIGRRSLDIYFIHFFLLPDLHKLGHAFYEVPNPLLEFVLSSLLVTVLVAVCLLLSYVVRRSDTMSVILFGRADH